MDRRGYAIVVYVTRPEMASNQGRILRTMSMARTIALVPQGMDASSLKTSFDEVIIGHSMAWVHMDTYQSILFLEEGWVPQSQMDRIFLSPKPSMSSKDPMLLLIEPSRFIPLPTDTSGLISTLVSAGLKWGQVDTRMFHRVVTRPSSSRGLVEHLRSILEPILGSLGDVDSILRNYEPIFQQAMTTKESNPSSNYELLEAYGDRFLGGQYTWLLLETPGVITPDQVTKITSYFQDRTRLAQLTSHLGLVPFIVLGKGQKMDSKIQSDVLEAFIATIGIVWQKARRVGNQAMKLFVLKVFSTYFNIEPERYLILYENPKTSLKNLAEELRMNRDKIIVSSPQEQGGKIVIIVSYDNHVLGRGEILTRGLYRDTAVDMATRAAFQDAIEKRTLQQLASTMNA